MSAPAPMNRSISSVEPITQPDTQSDSESDSDTEDFSDAPDMTEFLTAKNALQQMNAERKDHLDTMKRKRDELEDYMISKETKLLRLDGMIVQMKKSKKLSWSEKALRQHVDSDGKIDLDIYKSNQTQLVEKMTIKFN